MYKTNNKETFEKANFNYEYIHYYTTFVFASIIHIMVRLEKY